MENVGFQPSGEEIERALMDLGPLLGVTIKEEVPDELPDAASGSTSRLNVSGSITEGAGSEVCKEGAAEGADSLASPDARSPAAARCVLCRALLSLQEGTPKLMECLHSACEPCINAKLEERQAGSRDFLGAERVTVTCPACRLQCQVANMIDQRFVLEKLTVEQAGSTGLSGEQQCNSCEDTEPATSYCVDCAEFICDNCVNAHQRLKITKEHTIKSKQEAVAELQAAQNSHDMFCRYHVQERLTLFCETCDRLTCRDCQLQQHRDHKYQFSTEMAAQARASIAALLSEVSYKRVLLGSAMKVIRDRQALIADKKKALVHEITQTVVKLTNAINTRGKQLVLRLNEVCDAKQRTLSEKKDALEQLAAITDHCVSFVNGALEQGSDTAVLYSKRAVCAHLQRIKSRRADIPNPEIPVRISLALDKLPDLVRVLSSIGAIVVDGKVDGAGGAQGPYHPPAAPAPAPAPAPASAAAPAPAPAPASAIMALQHVAMHQPIRPPTSGVMRRRVTITAVPPLKERPYVQGGYMSLQPRHARAPPPHVTSTTHPHQLHGMSELNLRGLLNAQGTRGRSPHAAHNAHHAHAHAHAQAQAQAMHHAYQQMMGYASNAFNSGNGVGGGGGGGGCGGGGGGGAVVGSAGGGGASGRRSGGPRTPSPAPSFYPPHAALTPNNNTAALKWHIPQQGRTNGAAEMSPVGGGGGGGTEFKITLGRAPRAPAPPPQPLAPAPNPSAVTSTNPKTPSPSLNGGGCGGGGGGGCGGVGGGGGGGAAGGAGAMELDKVCAESVQDLMATIAKLDSNGVQVLPEAAPSTAHAHAPSPHPHVHSSTDPDHRPASKPAEGTGGGGGDPNEDWCAVCMDGGELMCCDKCPKVFHQYCHIPTIEKLPDETESWQCLLCVNFSEMEEVEEGGGGGGALSARLQRVMERVTLELYCQYETSLPFREPVPQDNLHYHNKISRPMCLDMIRMKLQPRCPQRYTHVAQFVNDCRLLFRNAYTYNPPDSSIYKDAKRLEEFFEAQLLKWLPEYAAIGPAPASSPALAHATAAAAAAAPSPSPSPASAWGDAPVPKKPRADSNC